MNVTGNMEETMLHIYNEVFETFVPDYFKSMEYTPWVFSLLGSALIGLAGILPLLIIPKESSSKDTKDCKFFYLFCYIVMTFMGIGI